MKKSIRARVILPVIIFLVFFLGYLWKTSSIKSVFYIDEYFWVGRVFYTQLFIDKDYSNNLWQLYGIDGDPKLASYIYGIFLYPGYLRNKEGKTGYDMLNYLIDHYIYPRSFIPLKSLVMYDSYLYKNRKYNKLRQVLQGFKMMDNYKISNKAINKGDDGFNKIMELVLVSRRAAALFTSLSVIVVYFLSLLLINQLFFALLVALMFGIGNIVVLWGLAAHSETFFIFFMTLSIFLMISIFSQKKSRLLSLILLGLLISLTIQTKLNGLILVLVLNLFFLLKTIKIKRLLPEALIINLIIAVFYIGLNPFLYRQPIKNILFQYQYTYKTAKVQQTYFTDLALLTPASRIKFITANFFSRDNVINPFFVNKKSLIASVLNLFLVITFIAGFIGLTHDSIKDLIAYFSEKDTLSPRSIFYIIFLCIVTVTIPFLMLAWDRYLIHLIAPFLVVCLIGFITMLEICNKINNIYQRLIALVLLILLFPFFLLFYILVKLTSKGPFIFKQKRMGKDRKTFWIYKIRTMIEDAESQRSKLKTQNEADWPVFKIYNDPRYTKIGKFLAHSALDELPQLVNIIKGEMNFVGPRPLPVDEANKVSKKYEKRFSVLPGMTSLWIAQGADHSSFDRWMKTDLKYIKGKSFFSDLIIISNTIWMISKFIVKKINESSNP